MLTINNYNLFSPVVPVMKKDQDYFYMAPLGLHFNNIAKQYIGALTKRLASVDVDRYFYTLVLIENLRENVTQQQLSALLCIDKVSMVRVIDCLTKQKLVIRTQNQEDRREYFLELTEKARAYLPEIKKGLQETNIATLKGLSAEEKVIFYSILKKITCNLSTLPIEKVDLNFKRITQ